MTSKERRSAANGIWLCQTHAKAVDDDPVTYPRELLLEWRGAAEAWARQAIDSGPKAAATPEYGLSFALLSDRAIRSHNGQHVAMFEFRLLNTTSPPAEVTNIFGQIWTMGSEVLASTLAPQRRRPGDDQVEWDVQIAVLPKEGIFVPTAIAIRPPVGTAELMIGAQFVAKEVDRLEYLWRVTSNGPGVAIERVKPAAV